MRNVYDFDKTIYDGDSTLDFYFFCLKKNKKILLCLPIQLISLILYVLGFKDKNYFKEKFYSFLFKISDIDSYVNEFWEKNFFKIKTWYLKRKKATDVIISASPSFLLITICKKLNVNLISSDVDSKTGKLLSNNCYGEEKIIRYNDKYPKSVINNFYSDSYSDESLAFNSKHAFIVKKDKIVEWDFSNKSKFKRRFKRFIKSYTILFVILFIGCFEIYFFKYNKSYFRSYDGLDQHYLIFSYIGIWFRNIFFNLINNHSLVISLWDNGIGYGSDILISCAAYFFDFFNYISIFFKPEYSEIGYNFMIILKIYACGLSFGLFGIYKKYDNINVLIGSILYCFCCSIFIAFIESFFINPMYIFPLLIIGTDMLLKEGKYKIYVFFLSLSFINYFYFAYMMCIFVFFYVLLEVIFNYDIYKYKIFDILTRFIVFSLISFGISSFIIFPIINNMLNMGRLNVDYYLPNFYSFDYYKCILNGFSGYCSILGRDAIIGYGVVSLISLISFFLIKNKKYNKLKIEFIMLTLVLLIPFLGSLLNGFSYFANRWIFAYSFIVSYIVCIMVDELKILDNKKYFYILFICLLYFFIILVCFKYINIENVIMLLLSVLFISLFYKYKNNKKMFNNIFLSITIISLIFNSSFVFRMSKLNGTSDKVEKNTAYNNIFNNGGLNLLKSLDNDYLRYNQFNIGKVRNSGWFYNRSGTDFYISMYNNDINEFNDGIGLNTPPYPMEYDSLDRKSELLYLLGVNYFIVNKNNIDQLPYNYTKNIISNDNFAIYSPLNKSSMVYQFNNVLNVKDYEKMNSYDKQVALTKSIVLENENTNYKYSKEKEINYTISFGNNITLYNGVYEVKDRSYIDLLFDDVSDGELYLYLNNINFNYLDKNSYNVSIETYDNNEKNDFIYGYINGTNNKNHMYGNKQNYLLNLGYNDSTINKIRIWFDVGSYCISDIKIYNREKNEIENTFNNLNNVSNNLKFDNNVLNTELIIEEDGYIFVSLPYANGGWNAYIDGKKVDVLKANGAFVGIKVTKGNHLLVMKYRTPYLILGTIVSIFSIILLFLINKYSKIFKNFFKKNENLISYLFFGVLTVIINIISYYFLFHLCHIILFISNAFAWIISVIFAFFSNKFFVFKNRNTNIKKEFFSFIFFRLITLIIDSMIMYVFVSYLDFNDLIVKIISNVVVVVLNYIFSKVIIFS